ncbi:MAG TPA: glycosyltransferase family 2 protein [Vicinamibacterales bacterium]|nr:glycosyltransferase family 2 protein [Vicinamibacterales bacterium]
MTDAPALSLVTPALNEADNLPVFYARASAAADATGLAWEWIVIDDHSHDRTFDVISELSRRDARVRGLRFARRSGSHIAIACGIDQARGDAAVVLAADLQDPPETLGALVARWRAGAEVVWAARSGRSSRSNGWLARGYYWMMRRPLGMTSMPEAGADFFLIDRKVIDTLRQFRETHVSLIALITWLGFRQEQIEYDKQPRLHGASGWPMSRKAKLVFDSLTGFSALPVTACWLVGLCMVAASLALALAGFAGVGVGVLAPPLVIVVAAVGVVGGIGLVMLGVIGEYVWRTLDETRRRPRYVIEATTAGVSDRIGIS